MREGGSDILSSECACACVCVCLSICLCVCACVCAYMYACMCAYLCAHAHVYMHAFVVACALMEVVSVLFLECTWPVFACLSCGYVCVNLNCCISCIKKTKKLCSCNIDE